ncbi:MAG: hypothetical protein AB2L20_00995 [Mangrovibacterium sp.]
MNENYKVQVEGDQMVIIDRNEGKQVSFNIPALFDLADFGGSKYFPKTVKELLFADARLTKAINEEEKITELEGIPVSHDTICDAELLAGTLEELELELSFPEHEIKKFETEEVDA